MMTYKEIYENFKRKFPFYSEHICKWKPIGERSILIRMPSGGGDFVYTFHNPYNWSFETIKSYYMRKNSRKEVV